MNLSDFDILSFDGKASLISKYGRYLDQRVHKDGSRTIVYDLFGFYVEVSYRKDRRVQYIRSRATYLKEAPDYPDELSILNLN
jgi:hypothetical protein